MAKDEILFDWLKDETVYIRQSLEQIHKKLDNHAKECPALQAFLKKPSIVPSGKPSWLSLMVKLGPMILAAALGLMGIGAYFGGQSNAEKLEKDLAAVQKLLKEIE